jgi:hypothetical protein
MFQEIIDKRILVELIMPEKDLAPQVCALLLGFFYDR